ncbi:uL30 family ribosomal protein [Candidatus Woesearchaeota archaeon]|nr:uL30 family ribosomal protein [Candidatus Woesearchaeota archaeon]
MKAEKIAVVAVRGFHDLNEDVKKTLKLLNMHRRNVCVVVPNTPNVLGMVSKIKKYVTYGEIDDETLALLKKKKGDYKYYNLNSPRKGYGRKGIKKDFVCGGALGYRGAAINDLIKRMLQ